MMSSNAEENLDEGMEQNHVQFAEASGSGSGSGEASNDEFGSPPEKQYKVDVEVEVDEELEVVPVPVVVVDADPIDVEQENLSPIMVDLILEKVFLYFENSLKDLKNFRIVCKKWESKVVRTIRSISQIDVKHLLSSAMEGVDVQITPHTGPFENIALIGHCSVLEDENVIEWFQANGSTVKQLCYCSSLSCYHETRFLECCLKLWCPNMICLCFDGVKSFRSFNQYSRFDDTPFVCQLKEILIRGKTEGYTRSRDCRKNLPTTFLNFDGGTYDRVRRDRKSEYDVLFTDLLQKFANGADQREIEDGIKLADARYEADGGIFGKILQNNSIETILIKSLSLRYSNTLLMAFLRKHKAGVVPTLKFFEYGNFQMFLSEYQFRALQKFYFPLTKICIGSLMSHMSPQWISELLASYANTLHYVEFGGHIVLWDYEDVEEREFIEIDIPLLPYVTTFINGNIFCTRLTTLDFIINLPKLERCSLTNTDYHSSIFPLNPTQVFNLLFQAGSFENQVHPLRELKMSGNAKISFTRHIELLAEWFPYLRKVDLILEGADVFVEFMQMMKRSELEDVKLSFYSNDNEWCNAGITNNLNHLSKLRFLELVHLSDHPLVITAKTCTDGFCEPPELISLTLENFGMFLDEMQTIRDILSKIMWVKFPKCVLQHRPVDIEFSVCNPVIPVI